MLYRKEETQSYIGDKESYEVIKKEVESSKAKNPQPSEEQKTLRKEFIKEAGFSPDDPIGLERIISSSDLMGINYLSRGLRAAKAVGRITIYNVNGKPAGYGTGFMISPRLILTNNHVIKDKETANAATAQMDYEVNIYGQQKNFSEYRLMPEDFFYTNKDLDFSIIAVNNNPVNKNQRILQEFGWLKIYRETGKVLEYEYLTIVQHPGGEPKQIALRENKLIKVLETSLRYTTDTAPGSSGSCVFNDQWQVVALHNMGVPQMEGDKYVTVDGRKITAAQIRDEREVKWIANQGIRLSRIIEHVSSMQNHPLIDELFEKNILLSTQQFNKDMDELNRKIQERYRANNSSNGTQPAVENLSLKTAFNNQNNKLTITVPVTIEVGVGSLLPGMTFKSDAKPVEKNELPGSDLITEEAIKVDPDYTKREGYLEDFLKDGKMKIKFPKLSVANKKAVAKLINSPQKYVLDYYHYSVIMNKARRMPFFTAVNIEGSSYVSINRKSQGGDKWFQDPRISLDHQLNDDIYYKNKLDRGHMVRREDPNWGGKALALKANSDTFHHTNACTQHEDLNQKTWLMLEEYLLKYAVTNKERMCVFTGPVFSKDDPPYREGIRLPLEFWKVAVYMKDGKLQSVAYVRSQREWIDDLEKMKINEEQIKTWQISIKELQKKTGLTFDTQVVKADRYKPGGVTLNEAMKKANKELGKIIIESEADIDL